MISYVSDKVRLYGQIRHALLEARETGTDPFAAVETILPWDTFASSVAEAQELAQPAEFDFPPRLSEKYQTLRRYAPAFLDMLQLRAAPAARELLAAGRVGRWQYYLQLP